MHEEYLPDVYTYKTTDQNAFNRILKAHDAHLALFDIKQFIRNTLKYDGNLSECEEKTLYFVGDKVSEIIADYNIDLDSL